MSKHILPRDVDLTLKMDFNVSEPLLKGIKLPKELKDNSYKRYHKYKRHENQTTSLYSSSNAENTYSEFTSGFVYGNITSTTVGGFSSSFGELFNRDIVEVEERVCWRSLYMDPDIYGSHAIMSEEDAIDYMKNLNFPLGSKNDRLLFKLEMEKQKRGFCGGHYCDCCGKKLNMRNCLSHDGYLCSSCSRQLRENIEPVKI